MRTHKNGSVYVNRIDKKKISVMRCNGENISMNKERRRKDFMYLQSLRKHNNDPEKTPAAFNTTLCQ